MRNQSVRRFLNLSGEFVVGQQQGNVRVLGGDRVQDRDVHERSLEPAEDPVVDVGN